MDDRQEDALSLRPVFETLEARLHLDANVAVADLQVADDIIVYRAWDGNDYEIFLYDDAGLKQITDNSTDDMFPHTDGESIVWQGYDGNDYDIFLYNGESTQQLTDNTFDDTLPRVDGPLVVWLGMDNSGTDNEIYLHDIDADTVSQITSNTVNENHVRISGDNVVWYAKSGSDNEIFLYNSEGITQVTSNNVNDVSPEVSDDYIVWRGDDLAETDPEDEDGDDQTVGDADDDNEIFLYEIEDGTITTLTNNDGHDNYPGLTDSSVFWSGPDSEGGDDREIFRYDLAEGLTTQLSDNDVDDWAPAINSDGAIWIDNSDDQVYRWSDSGGSVKRLTENSDNYAMAALDGETLVWTEDGAVWLMDTTGEHSLVQFTSQGQLTEPLVSIESVTTAEGNGPRELEIIIRLSGPTTHAVTMNYATADGTALADQDYTATSGSITFLPGDVARSISVMVLGDYELEEDEYFDVAISSLQGAVLSSSASVAAITLTDDDTPTVSVYDAQVIEGDSPGDARMRFTISVSKPLVFDVTVDYLVRDGVVDTEDDIDDEEEALLLASMADGDYEDASGKIIFIAGELISQYIYVDINGDTDTENHEQFFLDISVDPTEATLGNATATGTILNDDVEISFPEDSLEYSQDEGDTGDTTFTITVQLSHPSAEEVSVQYATDIDPNAMYPATVEDTENEITGDYESVAGELVFEPGETSVTFTVTVHGDEVIEPHETFVINLSDAVNGVILTDQAIVEIFDDDAPRLSISDVTVVEGAPIVEIYPIKLVEGDEGVTQQYEFLLTLSQAQTEEVTVEYKILTGTTEPEDFQTDNHTGSIVFAAGQTQATLSVDVYGDSDNEDDEYFKVQLVRVDGNAELPETTSVYGWILNDDQTYASPRVSCYDFWGIEGDSGDTYFPVTVKLSQASDQELTVNYSVTNGSAVAGTDYVTTANGTLTFAAGEIEKYIEVPVIGDTESESNKVFNITLSNPSSGLSLLDGAAKVTILDDDQEQLYAEFTVQVSNIVEGDDGYEYDDITVYYATTDDIRGEAGEDGKLPDFFPAYPGTEYLVTPDTDYIFTTGSLTFTLTGDDPELTQTIRVPIVGDRTAEETETFRVELYNAENAKIVDDFAVGTLTNDDTEISFEEDSLTVTQTEGDSGTTVFDFFLKMSHQITRDVRVYFSTSDGTAISSSEDENEALDFVAKEYSSVLFTRTDRPDDDDDDYETEYYAHITIAVHGDALIEDDETFTLTLVDANGGTIVGQKVATATIRDDDTPLVSISDAEVIEGDDGQKYVKLTVTLSRANDLKDVTVKYATAIDGEYITTIVDEIETTTFVTANNAATEGEDFVSATDTLVFTDGQTSKTITIQIKGDTHVEASETFLVQLSDADGAILDDEDEDTDGDKDTGRVTILNDDTGISIADVQVIEGTGPSNNVRLSVLLTEATTEDVTVWWMTDDGTATAADYDYTPAGGQLTIAAGETKAEFTVEIIGDDRVETSEDFDIVLFHPDNAVITKNRATVTILDDDIPWLSISDAKLIEGDSGQTEMVFHVTLRGSLEDDNITVYYITSSGDAEAGSDYIHTEGTLTFTPGQNSDTISVKILGDAISEPDENFTVTLSNPSNNVIITDAEAQGTIQNDDAKVYITDSQIKEGHNGTATLVFTLSLEHASATDFSVSATTADGTAIADEDYTAKTSTIEFSANQQEATFSVEILSDLITENDETFYVLLSEIDPGTILDDSATGTILNDDADPRISALDGEVIEGNQGTSYLDIILTLSNPSALPVTVKYATQDATAQAPGDYQSITDGTATFEAGQTSYTISIPVHSNSDIEPDKDFLVLLSEATNAEIENGSATAYIRNDDTLINIEDAQWTETDTAQGYMTFRVTLSAATTFEVSVHYATSDGSATASEDYYLANGTLTFNAGDTEEYITIPILGDLVAEADEETFILTLSQATNASLAAEQATGTIIDNDPDPEISIGNITVIEGDSGVKTAVATVTLSNPAAWPVSVDYATADGSASSASDYQSSANTLTFQAGQTSRTISLGIYGDTTTESDEVFWLNLSNASGGYIVQAQGQITIADDDTSSDSVTISLADTMVTEGHGGSTVMEFTVTLSRESDTQISVAYKTVDGTATMGSGDYQPATGTLTFSPGITSQTVWIQVYGDDIHEQDEQFTLSLYSASGAIIAVKNAVGVIVNDDAAPQLTIPDVYITEGDDGTVMAEISANLSAVSGSDISFDWATSYATASSASDFIATFGTLIIPAGQSSASFSVAIVGDTIYEDQEYFNVIVDSDTLVGATLEDNLTAVYIDDNDPTPAPQPDLSLSFYSIKMSTIAIPGEKATVKLRLTNEGDLKALGLMGISLYASTDGILDESDLLLTSTSMKKASISPGKYKNYTLKFTVSGDMPDDQSYQLLAVAEYEEAVGDSNPANDIAIDSVLRSSPWQFGATAGQSKATLKVEDSAGTSITISLTGGGWGEVVGTDSFTQILLYDTTVKSTLTVKASGNAAIQAGALIIDGPLKTLNAPTLALSQDSTIAAKTVKLGDLSGQATLTIGDAVSPVNMTLGEVTDMSIESDAAIGTLKLERWTDTDDVTDLLSAPSVSYIKTTGVSKGPAGDFQADLAVTELLKTATIKGNLNADWSLGSAGKITVYGDMNDSNIETLSALTGKTQSLKSLKVLGSISNSTVESAGDIGLLQAMGMFSSDVMAGVSSSGKRAESAADFSLDATIKTLKIKGSGSSQDRYLYDSNISAATLGTITLVNGDFTSSQISFNARSDADGKEIKLIKHTDKADKLLSWKYPPKTNQSFEGPDDIIRLL